jgi:hypothetical protein
MRGLLKGDGNGLKMVEERAGNLTPAKGRPDLDRHRIADEAHVCGQRERRICPEIQRFEERFIDPQREILHPVKSQFPNDFDIVPIPEKEGEIGRTIPGVMAKDQMGAVDIPGGKGNPVTGE